MKEREIVAQTILAATGKRPKKCRHLVTKQAEGLTQSVWWARSHDGREWRLLLTPDDCGLAGASGCVDVMIVEIRDRSARPVDH